MPSTIIARAEEFFYFEDELTDCIEAWASTKCKSFTPLSNGQEHPLSHQELFLEYQSSRNLFTFNNINICYYYLLFHFLKYLLIDLFVEKMSTFLTKEGCSIQDFFLEVQKELGSRLDKEATFASVLLSAIDFSFFCDMMQSVREGSGVIFCPPLVPVMDDDDELLSTQAMPKQCNIVTEEKDTKGETEKVTRIERDRDYKGNHSSKTNYRK